MMQLAKQKICSITSTTQDTTITNEHQLTPTYSETHTKDTEASRREKTYSEERQSEKTVETSADCDGAPVVPTRYITPKLVVVQSNTLKKRARKRRPKHVAPPPPKKDVRNQGYV